MELTFEYTDIRIIAKRGETSPREYTLTAGNFQMGAMSPKMCPQSTTSEEALKWRLYVDTSASGIDTEALRLDTLSALLESAPKSFEIDSAKAFDIDIVHLLIPGLLLAEKEKHSLLIQQLKERHALGVTNLEKVRLALSNACGREIHLLLAGVENDRRRGAAAHWALTLSAYNGRHPDIRLHRHRLPHRGVRPVARRGHLARAGRWE